MAIFPFPQFKHLVGSLKNLPDYKLGSFQVGHFPNQEIYTKISTNVENKECMILGSISPPSEHLISFLFLSHTLKKEKAFKITALLPYLAYARQDKIKRGESLATSNIGELFRASHIDEVVTIDVHSPQVEGLFPLPINNLSPAKLFAKEIKKLKIKKPTFVAPDEGAIERTKAVLNELNIKAKVTYLKKERTLTSITSVLYGAVSNNAVIIDDILDTGKTLLTCCKILKNAGVKNIYICVTHGLFTGDEWLNLFNLNVKSIYCTDSIPQVYNLKFKSLKILSIKTILKDYAYHTRKIQKEAKKAAERIEKGAQDLYMGE